MIRNISRCTIVALTVFVGSSSANAEIVTYLVEFAQSGNVALGSTVDWTVTATVSDSDAGNFGIRTAAVDLMNNQADVMSAGTIAAPFADYQLPNGGTGGAGTLTNLGAGMITYVAPTLEGADGDLGPHVLATGSYTVNTLGVHTLTTALSANTNFYFNGPANGSFAAFDSVVVGSSDSVTVVAAAAVPEPASMLLVSTFLGSIVVVGRRRRRRATAPIE